MTFERVINIVELEAGLVPRPSKRIRSQRSRLTSTDESAITAASKFISVVGDDILSEIFLRLSDRRSLIQCSTVCKRWFSLISCAHFICSFVRRHQHRRSSDSSHSLPYAFLFTYSCRFDREQMYQSSKIPRIIENPTPDYLKFLPWPRQIKASCDDLLLVTYSPSPWSIEYCVCNPVTRERFVLPEPPIVHLTLYGSLEHHLRSDGSVRPISHGLVCKYKGCNKQLQCSINAHYYFKVMLILDNRIETAIFCSETGEWSKTTFLIPQRDLRFGYLRDQFVAHNGILYSIFTAIRAEVDGLVALDPFNNDVSDPDRCCFIRLPLCFSRTGPELEERLRFGVVQGRLRLAQLLRSKTALKVWEFDCAIGRDTSSASSWVLVHQSRIRMERTNLVSILAFDPNASDVIFLLRDQIMCRHHILENKYDNVCQFPIPTEELRYLHLKFKLFTQVYPSWPTPIHVLPSM